MERLARFTHDMWYARDGEPLTKYPCESYAEALANADDLRKMSREHDFIIRIFITERNPS